MAIKKVKGKEIYSQIKRKRIILDQNEIKKVFYKYYANLFKSEVDDKGKIKQYLQENNLKKVPERVKKVLDQEITSEEIMEAIGELKLGKSPGTDGITSGLYKLYKTQLMSYLGQLMNAVMKGEEIPYSWKQAPITLISKDDLEVTEVKNYRPISLLNIDYKIYTKFLVNRLKGYLTKYISEDLAGFLPWGHIKDNIRTLLNVIEEFDKNPDKKLGLIFVDAEKVFDNLKWEFMTIMLEDIDIGNNF